MSSSQSTSVPASKGSDPASRQGGLASTGASASRAFPIGAEVTPDGVSFRVWADRRKSVAVVFEGTKLAEHPLQPDGEGHFAGVVPGAKAGDRYKFRLDGDKEAYPDPASRYQPDGVHGASEVVDPRGFKWSDAAFPGLTVHGQVIYELHVGTFTQQGDWTAATERLKTLKELGITCIEVMPVNEYAGTFGWGYDGVDLYAPSRNYGRPDDFRTFVNAAHALGMGVILDVVYNHLGPAGAYVEQFSEHYFSTKHKNDWGTSLNFDDTNAAGVREYFITNARHWIAEYHLDGLRLDATHAIVDDTQRHFLLEMSELLRNDAGAKHLLLVAENEAQQGVMARPPEEGRNGQGGYGLSAIWNDDFHHSAMVALTGRNEAFYSDYAGGAQEFVSAAKHGFLFQGQVFSWHTKARGTPSLDLPPTAFVHFIQNHDQVANFGTGQRMTALSGSGQLRAMTALLLLMPQTPLLFMGQEFDAAKPFTYFADHEGDLPRLIREGRLRELSQFPSQNDPKMHARIADPSKRETFEMCKLDWSVLDLPAHRMAFEFHKDLIALRKSDPVLVEVQKSGNIDGAVLGAGAFILRFFGSNDDRLLVVNFETDIHAPRMPEPLIAPPRGMKWDVVFSTEDPSYGGLGYVPLETQSEKWRRPGENWRLTGHSAMLLKPVKV